MRVPRAARSGLLLCVLCLFGGASAAIAASGHRSSHHRSSHAARACHRQRAKHRHCLATRGAKKSHHKHTRGAVAKPSTPGGAATGTGSSSSSGAPWTAAPAPVIPGSSTPGSGGTHPGSPGSDAPTKTPTAPTGPAHVQVTAEDTEAFRFILSRPSVPAGEVVIEFVNHGQDEHNLNALDPGGEPVPGGSLPDTAPNAHPSLTLNLHAGSYTFFCSIKDHEAKGMKATLLVE
jgi:plastocyanin